MNDLIAYTMTIQKKIATEFFWQHGWQFVMISASKSDFFKLKVKTEHGNSIVEL